jgi:VanZ family protein
MAANRLGYLLPAAICLVFVFGFSSQSYDKQTLIPFLQRHISVDRLSAWLPDIRFRYGHLQLGSKGMPYHFVEFLIRKCAHVFSYSVLGCSLYYAFNAFRPLADKAFLRWPATAAGLAAVAMLDEWNQTQVDMRTGQAIDVWLDAAGGTLGACLAIYGIGGLFRKGGAGRAKRM